jgi:hypothetical protein
MYNIDIMHQERNIGESILSACKAKRMVRGVVLLSGLYVVMWLTHNYMKFKMVLCQVKLRSLLKIIKNQILQSYTNSALSRSRIIW